MQSTSQNAADPAVATFEAALDARAQAMADACTRCGKCVEVCPITEAAGLHIDPHLIPPPFRGRNEIAGNSSLPLEGGWSGWGSTSPTANKQSPVDVIGGIIDIVRTGQVRPDQVRPDNGNDAARKWANACILSGECIKACDYGVNPRFLLAMARLERARKTKEPVARRKQGVDYIRKVGTEVSVLSQLQVSEDVLIRLGQVPAKTPPRSELPDVVFYTGCNVLKTPHIALLCLDMMDALGVDYQVMGGPTHCCGVGQLRAGDAETSSRFAANTINKLSQSKSGEVLAWCPSCFVHFSENMLPTFERLTGETPFDMTPF